MRVKPKDIVLSFKQTGSVQQTAKLLSIHRATVYRWLKRAKTSYGKSYASNNLKRKSTRPHTVHYALDSVDMVRVLKLRRRRERGYGVRKVRYLAKTAVHHNTIHRLLERHGLVKLGKLHRRPRFQDTVHMHAKNAATLGFLEMDVKYVTPELSGLP